MCGVRNDVILGFIVVFWIFGVVLFVIIDMILNWKKWKKKLSIYILSI